MGKRRGGADRCGVVFSAFDTCFLNCLVFGRLAAVSPHVVARHDRLPAPNVMDSNSRA